MIHPLNTKPPIREQCINESSLIIKSVDSIGDYRETQNLSGVYEDDSGLKTLVDKLLIEHSYDFTKLKGASVLIKPNWVRHNVSETDSLCLATHPRFILAVLSALLKHLPKKVLIADAPIQGCEWDKLLPKYFYEEVNSLSAQYKVPISIIDWRRRVLSTKNSTVRENIRSIDNYVLFDMGISSYLEPITTRTPRFRVTNYDPDRLAESHRPGKHMYCISREVFDVDYIIALPKAKTHQKTGITNALKLLVGINGDKDFLPHHRIGGERLGGDCYPGGNLILRLSEHLLDMANRRIGSKMYRPLRIMSKLFWLSTSKTPKHSLAAAWHGNDTTWRMVMDINMIAKYGKSDGTISDKPQRDILYICDGIIGGQGDGPLHPDPLPLGVVMVSENPALMDTALARLMGFDENKFPLLRAANEAFNSNNSRIMLNGLASSLDDLSKISVKTCPPPGWVDYLRIKDNPIG